MPKWLACVAAVAALSLPPLMLTSDDAAATKISKIPGKITKIALDGICQRSGGNSYGSASTHYGCTRGDTTIECNKDGDCVGIEWNKPAALAPSGGPVTVEGLLVQPRGAGMPGPGLLDDDGGPGPQGPAATGTPSAPSAPPLILK